MIHIQGKFILFLLDYVYMTKTFNFYLKLLIVLRSIYPFAVLDMMKTLLKMNQMQPI